MQEDDTDDSDSLTSSSSSEGELEVSHDLSDYKEDNDNTMKNFSFNWNPKPPVGLHYMCLMPFFQDYDSEYRQKNHTGKMKVSLSHRQQRINEFKNGRTTGRNILDEKKLRNAATQNNYELVIQLLQDGVDPCTRDNKKRTPLHFAASQGHETTVKILLERGADPNLKDVIGNTPLHLAACTFQIPVVTLLLKAGTDLKSVDNHGRTPLSLAKSTLKVISDNKTLNSENMKKQMLEVSDMMKTYLNLSGMKDEADHINDLCNKLQTIHTREDVDIVNNLLSDFTHLKLNERQKPG